VSIHSASLGNSLRRAKLVALALCTLAGAALQAETLRLATGELPPYASEKLPDQGIALDIVAKRLASLGMR
jgi:polar amino acid transport system substrate-binding protein